MVISPGVIAMKASGPTLDTLVSSSDGHASGGRSAIRPTARRPTQLSFWTLTSWRTVVKSDQFRRYTMLAALFLFCTGGIIGTMVHGPIVAFVIAGLLLKIYSTGGLTRQSHRSVVVRLRPQNPSNAVPRGRRISSSTNLHFSPRAHGRRRASDERRSVYRAVAPIKSTVLENSRPVPVVLPDNGPQEWALPVLPPHAVVKPVSASTMGGPPLASRSREDVPRGPDQSDFLLSLDDEGHDADMPRTRESPSPELQSLPAAHAVVGLPGEGEDAGADSKNVALFGKSEKEPAAQAFCP